MIDVLSYVMRWECSVRDRRKRGKMLKLSDLFAKFALRNNFLLSIFLGCPA